MTDEVARAVRAKQLLEDELFSEAWEGLERGAIERLAAADTNDTKTLQALTMSLQTVRAIRRRFEVWIAEGKEAAEREARRQEKPSMIQRFRR